MDPLPKRQVLERCISEHHIIGIEKLRPSISGLGSALVVYAYRNSQTGIVNMLLVIRQEDGNIITTRRNVASRMDLNWIQLVFNDNGKGWKCPTYHEFLFKWC